MKPPATWSQSVFSTLLAICTVSDSEAAFFLQKIPLWVSNAQFYLLKLSNAHAFIVRWSPEKHFSKVLNYLNLTWSNSIFSKDDSSTSSGIISWVDNATFSFDIRMTVSPVEKHSPVSISYGFLSGANKRSIFFFWAFLQKKNMKWKISSKVTLNSNSHHLKENIGEGQFLNRLIWSISSYSATASWP